MKIAKIKIVGVIGKQAIDAAFPLPDGHYTLAKLIGDIKSAGDVDGYEFYIDSPGGYIDEGFAIASYIEVLPNTTTVAVKVQSIANIIFFAGEKRRFAENSEGFMLHKSWTNVAGNEHELIAVAGELAKEDARMRAYISERTGLKDEELASLMKIDRYIDIEEAQGLGFFAMNTNKVAYKYIQNMNALKKAGYALARAVGIKVVMAMTITLKDGSKINIDSEDGEFVGKPTDAPDGVHELEDGRTLTVKDGMVTDEAKIEGDTKETETVALKEALAKIAELEGKLSEYNQAQAAMQEDKMKEEQAQATLVLAMAKEIETLKKGMVSQGKENPRNSVPTPKAQERPISAAAYADKFMQEITQKKNKV